MRPPTSQTKSKKEIYHEQYEASKVGGESFFPDTVVKDAIVGLLVVGAIIILAILYPAATEPPADPTSTTYNPRPEWYFLFFFQFLKLFPGALEPVAAAIIPMMALIILAIVPFLDRGINRRWEARKPAVGIGVLALLFLVVLEIGGAMSAPVVPAGEASSLVQAGQRVYREIECTYCHSINGVGGSIGPDLSNIGGEMDKQRLVTYLKNPHAMIPTTLHPKLQFTDEELNALVAYLATLGAPITYSPQAPGLFDKNCSSCHMINGKGGTLGPDLSTVGQRRSVNFLDAFTTDSKSVMPGATMPAYRNVLTPEEIKDIAGYLASLRGKTPSTAPSPVAGQPSQ